jgi:hypothetical protein
MATSGTRTDSSLLIPNTEFPSNTRLPIPLYGEQPMSVTSNYIGTKSELVVPFVAAMYADASGQMGVLQRQNVTITGIDDVFDVSCTVAQAVGLLNAFSVRDMDQTGLYGLSAEIAVGFTDASNSFSNALAEIVAFADTSANAMDASSTGLHAYLTNETHADLLAALAHDALANMLEASDLTVEIALDASSGGLNMATELAGNGSCPSGNAVQYRKAIFAQIPEYTIHQYLKVSDGSNNTGFEDVSNINFMPLLTGDVLTFVFDVTVGQYAMGSRTMPGHGANVQRVFRDANTVYPTGTGNVNWDPSSTNDVSFNQNASGGYVQQQSVTYTPGGGLTFVSPTKRRVALKVHLGSRDSAEGKVFNLTVPINQPGAVLAPTEPSTTASNENLRG